MFSFLLFCFERLDFLIRRILFPNSYWYHVSTMTSSYSILGTSTPQGILVRICPKLVLLSLLGSISFRQSGKKLRPLRLSAAFLMMGLLLLTLLVSSTSFLNDLPQPDYETMSVLMSNLFPISFFLLYLKELEVLFMVSMPSKEG